MITGFQGALFYTGSMIKKAPRIYLAAGEASGDLYAALLIEQLQRSHPNIQIRGLGGQRARNAGMHTVVDLKTVSVMGLTEVIRYYPALKGAMHELTVDMAEHKPDLLIAIDFQEFNQRLAKQARALGIPVLFFIAPQVWAWRAGRVKKAQHYADEIATLFAFEQPLFAPYVKTTHVGHPLVDDIEGFLAARQAKPDPNQIGLLPGSRSGEITRLLPVFIQAAFNLWQHNPDRHFVLPCAESIDSDWLEKYVDQLLPDPAFTEQIRIIDGQSRAVMQDSRLLLCASGTATLEAGLIGTPVIIGYKTSALTYQLGRWLIQTRFIGLPNILSQQQIVPELIQHALTAQSLTETAEQLLNDAAAEKQRAALAGLKAQLGNGGAITRLHQRVLDYLPAEKT